MFPALVLMLMLQDGPVRTAPEPPPPIEAGTASPSGQSPTLPAAAEPGTPVSPWAVVDRAAAEAGATPGEGHYRRVRAAIAAATPPESGVPAWALTDPARWETRQCGATGDEACRRQARNRLAMARAGVAAEPPAARGETSPPLQACRMVFRRAAEGVGGSMTRVCGDGADAEAALDRLESILPAMPAVASCERPDALETPEAWVARCRSVPPR